MKVIRFGDIYDSIENDDGTIEEFIIRSNHTMPIILNPHRIETIEPFMSLNCKLFKNVSVITYDSGKQFKVVGNYKELDKYKFIDKKIRKIGYGS